MSLSPKVLLSNAARIRLTQNLKNFPSFTYKDSTPAIKASVLVPICVVSGEVCLLYTLRSSNLSSHSGQMSFPGGKMDQNETVIETALRETKEEIGVASEDVDVWNVMSEVQGRNRDMVITPVIGYIRDFSVNKLKINHDEVEELYSVPIRIFSDSKNHAHFHYDGLMLPVYLGLRHKVWGITAMITHMFLQCFLPESVYEADFSRREFSLNELMSSKL